MATLTRAEQVTILRAAAESAPDEACGVLLIDADGQRRLHVGHNVQGLFHEAAPTRYRPATEAYTLDPDSLRMIARAQKAGGHVAVIWHSHPNGVDRLSRTDVTAALNDFGVPSYPGADYVLAVRQMIGEGPRWFLGGWGWSATSRAFVPISITTAQPKKLTLASALP